MYNIAVGAYTDVGDKKQINQDSILCKTGTFGKRQAGLYIVADGCGGLSCGEKISGLITARFSSMWDKKLCGIFAAKRLDMNEIDSFLNDELERINHEAIAFGKEASCKVGSTLSLLITADNKYIIKNIGDSRVYLERKGKLIQLTEDQSLVAEMVRSGELTKEEARKHKRKNVLTMCIGFFEDLKIYSKRGKIKNGDLFVLCCDGLYNHVSAEDMVKVLKNKSGSLEEKAKKLRESIPSGEAGDNVSAVICGYYKKYILHPLSILTVAAAAVALLVIFRDAVMDLAAPLIEIITK